MLSFLTPDLLDQAVPKMKTPVLIGFLRKGEGYTGQVKLLENLAGKYEERLKIYVGDEYYLENFFNRLGFAGTPFYLLMENGREIGRFFGKADSDQLIRFFEGKRVSHS